MKEDYGVTLPTSRSAQPWVSLESWLLLLVGIIWFFTCISMSFSQTERRFTLQTMTLSIAGIAAIAVVIHYLKIEVPFWRSVWRVNYYGPFPNRNNFSGLLSIGAVLALAIATDAYRRKALSWIYFLLGLCFIFFALLLNTSRMGVILFFGGISSWMYFSTIEKRSMQRLAVGTSILLLLASFFFLFGQHIIARFTQNVDLITTITSDARGRIFKDAYTVFAKQPFLGVGLANFEPIFAFSKTARMSHLITRELHPENDWLWFAVEAGLPAFLAALITFFALIRNFKSSHEERKRSSRKDLRLRNACAISIGILAIQGLVDTPLHTIGLATLGALMAGLALNPKRAVAVTDRISPLFSRALGVVCLAIGFLWLAVAAGRPVIPGTAAAKLYANQAQALSLQGDNAAALAVMNKAIAIHPLQWNYYFDRAQIKLRHGFPAQDALDDFSITRFLEPNNADLCLREMEIWLAYSPSLAIPAVREAMHRDRNAAYAYYQTIINYLYHHPELREAVRNLATDPKLRLLYLTSATGDDFKSALNELLASSSTLDVFTDKEKLQLFRLWYAQGDKTELITKLESNTIWRKIGWPVLAEHHASKGDFENACQLALTSLNPPAFASNRRADLKELERSFLHNMTDVVRGLELYEMQKVQGQLDAALTTLRQLAELPNFPVQIHYERAYILYRKKEYTKAWEALTVYMSKADVLSA